MPQMAALMRVATARDQPAAVPSASQLCLKSKAAGRLFHDVVENYAERHKIKPGITGLAQVKGYRGETDTEEKIRKRVEYDLYYMKHMSLFLDVFILLDTVRIILAGGATPAARTVTAEETIQEWARLKEQPTDAGIQPKSKLELETA